MRSPRSQKPATKSQHSVMYLLALTTTMLYLQEIKLTVSQKVYFETVVILLSRLHIPGRLHTRGRMYGVVQL